MSETRFPLGENFLKMGQGSDHCLCKTRLQRVIEATYRQIDQLVYELYGLTEAVIKIVEVANQGSR